MSKDKKRRYYVNDKKSKSRVELTLRDLRFLQAAEYIIQKNRQAGIPPDSYSSLGELIYPSNRSIISAVRNEMKHIPEAAVAQLALMFNLDLNYFYRDGVELKYVPKTNDKTEAKVIASDNAVANTGNGAATFHAGSGKIEGVNTGNGHLTHYVVQAERFIAQVPSELRDDFSDVIQKFKEEFALMQENLKSEIRSKNEDLKRTTDSYERLLKDKKRRCEKLEKDLERALEKMQEYMEKYVNARDENRLLRHKGRKK